MNDPEDCKVRRDVSIPPILSKIARDKNLVKFFLITLGIIFIFKLLAYVPLPGLNASLLLKFFNSINNSQVPGSLSVFTGASMPKMSIMALGLLPFLSACIITQILGAIVPFFKKDYNLEGQEARKKVVKKTYVLTVVLAVIQSFFLCLWLENPDRFQGLNVVTSPGWMFRITTILSLVAGVCLLLWLAKVINKYGIGNGIGVLVVSGILSRFVAFASQMIRAYNNNRLTGGQSIILLFTIGIVIAVIWQITTMIRKVPIKYNNSEIKTFIPLRLSLAGKAPLAFAGTLMIAPSLLRLGTGEGGPSIIYFIMHAICIVLGTFFYVAIVFNPKKIVERMNKYDCQMEKGETEIEPAKYLNAKMKKNTMLIAVLLITVTFFPRLCGLVIGRSFFNIAFLKLIPLMLVVGVFYDIKCQIEAYFQRKESKEKEWTVAYTAFDEIEAEIKKGFLATKNIACVVEPLRFTWGLPIRTAVDEYRMYVPTPRAEEAVQLLSSKE